MTLLWMLLDATLLLSLWFDISIQSFPDVTICNVNPFGHSDENTLTWSKYMAEMNVKKQQWPYEVLKSNISNLTVTEYNAIWGDLFSHVGFVTNLIPNISSQLQASKSQQLIVNCYLFNKDWGDVDLNGSCTLRFHWDQTYPRCYTIHIPQEMSTVREILNNICFVRIYFSYISERIISFVSIRCRQTTLCIKKRH